MRTVSNYASFGEDGGSWTVKFKNPRMSRAAAALYAECSGKLEAKRFHDLTTNEHSDPLSEVWGWLVSKVDTLNPDAIIERFERYPMITITKNEDKRIRDAGYKSSGSPADRFKSAGIEIVEVELKSGNIVGNFTLPE